MRSVLAAGGVLWRPAPGPAAGAGAVEVAVVHRPRYDDWSLPKGKLDPGEIPLLGALREVREETGSTAVPGRTLGQSRYEVLVNGKRGSKTVRWWAMRAGEGEFVPGSEVDELRWLPPRQAGRLLTAGRDQAPLRLLVRAGLGLATVLLVRHGRAGDKAHWPGDDDLRPLDERGLRQAAALAQLLPAYGVARVLSAPPERCTATVAAVAERLGLPVELEPAFGEQAYAELPERAEDRLRDLAQLPGASVVCSQGGAIPGLVELLAKQSGLDLGGVHAPKGSVWALSLRDDGQLVDADRTLPLA